MSKRKKPYNYIIVTDNNLINIIDKISDKSTITDDTDASLMFTIPLFQFPKKSRVSRFGHMETFH